MAATHKYTVEFAGETFTRRTARTYTHVVVVKSDAASCLAAALQGAKEAAKYHAHYGKTRDEYYVDLVANTLMRHDEALARGDFTTYGVLAWCGRPDLAQKEADRARRTGRYAEVHIVPVPPVG